MSDKDRLLLIKQKAQHIFDLETVRNGNPIAANDAENIIKLVDNILNKE